MTRRTFRRKLQDLSMFRLSELDKILGLVLEYHPCQVLDACRILDIELTDSERNELIDMGETQ